MSEQEGEESEHVRTLPKLTIRRHPPGSTDPSAQRIPAPLESSPADNLPSSSNVHVTIKRNPQN